MVKPKKKKLKQAMWFFSVSQFSFVCYRFLTSAIHVLEMSLMQFGLNLTVEADIWLFSQ